MIKRRNFKLIIAVACSVLILLYQVTSYNDMSILEDFKSAYHKGTDSFRYLLSDRITTNQVIFPYSFPVEGKALKQFLLSSNSLIKLDANRARIIKPHELHGPLTQRLKDAKYSDHLLKIYTDQKSINLDLDKCNSIQTSATIEITSPKLIDVSLQEILVKFISEAETNPYYKDISEFFLEELKLQLKYNVVDHYWYRLAGSSVWLEEYQTHFMISRIMYSPRGHRNQPLVSLTYGQLFDKNWKEMTNTKIIVPTNNIKSLNDKNKESKDSKDSNKEPEPAPEEETEERHYKLIKFPYFLPIPFWYDLDNLSGKYFGPEDPRLMLVKNKAGYEEPLIVFNAQHRKLVHFDDDSDNKILLKSDFYRSMFVCWPWQFQKGKVNTDGFKNSQHDNKYFNKVIELKIKNIPRSHKQKNWTPFLSESSRASEGFDKYVNFIYRWANFEVLKCDITYDTGICAFEYRLNPDLDTKQAVGPFRGGTDLININTLLGDHAKDFIHTDREIWVGFTRAHIDDCGCGSNMYRPNLVVVTKDQVIDDYNGRYHARSLYKISHVSSSISFNIPIIGWNLLEPLEVCSGPNVLIPNGISYWAIDDYSKKHFMDYLTLSLSVSDYTVHTIHIKGLLKEIIHLSHGHIFDDVVEDEKSLGFNNDNLVCALQLSTEFCAEYGRNHTSLLDNNIIHKIFDYDSFEEQDPIEETKEFLEEDKDIADYERAVQVQRMYENYMKNHSPPVRQGSPAKSPNQTNTSGKPKETAKAINNNKSGSKSPKTPNTQPVKGKPEKSDKDQGTKGTSKGSWKYQDEEEDPKVSNPKYQKPNTANAGNKYKPNPAQQSNTKYAGKPDSGGLKDGKPKAKSFPKQDDSAAESDNIKDKTKTTSSKNGSEKNSNESQKEDLKETSKGKGNTKENPKQSSKEDQKENSKESPKQNSKENTKESPKQNSKESQKENSKENPKLNSKGNTKENPKQSSKESQKENSKESQKENPKENTKEGPKQNSKESQKQNTKEGPKQNSKENTKENPKQSSKENQKENSKGNSKENPKEQKPNNKDFGNKKPSKQKENLEMN